jgi:hypothetical protein
MTWVLVTAPATFAQAQQECGGLGGALATYFAAEDQVRRAAARCRARALPGERAAG